MPKCAIFLPLRHTFYFHAISQELLKIETINTPLEPLQPAGVPFGGLQNRTGFFCRKIDFWL